MMDIEHGFAGVNGTRLHYEIAGDGSPLVLIHGFGLDLRMWDAQFEAFAQQRRVIRYDMRGFGKSALPGTERYGHEADLKALLTHLGIERADLIGLSLGGGVAIDFALAYPDVVRALIPVDAMISGFRLSERWLTPTRQVWEIGRNEGIQAARSAWIAHPLFAPMHDQPKAAERLAQMVADYSGWHFANKDTVVAATPPAAQRLGEIKAQTLVMVGERDLPDFQQMADEMTRQIPSTRKFVLPKVGHMANMEAPAQF